MKLATGDPDLPRVAALRRRTGTTLLNSGGDRVNEKQATFDVEAYAPFPLRDFSAVRSLAGIPDPLMEAHEKLYQGYVTNANLLRRLLKEAQLGTPAWSEMKRRIGFELGGLRLHELYFENLKAGGSSPSPALEDVLAATWGSFNKWKEEFEAVVQMRGIGWAILYQDPEGGRLSNHWIGLHEEGHPPGFRPLLVVDVWEHAYTGMTRSKYFTALSTNLDWEKVEERTEARRSS
jgi:Fe-Mn family superoxide dismutase